MITYEQFTEEARTKYIHERFMPIFDDIDHGKDFKVLHRKYLMSDEISAYYETSDPNKLARVYYQNCALTPAETEAQKILSDLSSNNKYIAGYERFFADGYRIDIIDSFVPLPGRVNLETLRNFVTQIYEILRILKENNIIHCALDFNSFGIVNNELMLIDFSTVVKLHEGQLYHTDAHRMGTGIFDSPESRMNDRFYPDKSHCYSIGNIIATLYLGRLLSENEVLNGIQFQPDAPRDLTVLIDRLTQPSPDARGGIEMLNDWLTMTAEEFTNIFPPIRHSFEFKGGIYTRRFTLASAMANNWEELKRHLQALHTIAICRFLIELYENDLAVKLAENVTLDEIQADPDLACAKACYLLAQGSNHIFWKGEFTSSSEITNSKHLTEMILSGYLTWIYEQQHPDLTENDKKCLADLNTLREVTAVDAEIGKSLAAYMFGPTDNTPQAVSLFSTLYENRSIEPADAINKNTLAALVFCGVAIKNIQEFVDETKIDDGKITKFYELFESCCEKEVIRQHYILFGPYKDNLSIRQNVEKNLMYYNNDSKPQPEGDLGINDIPDVENNITAIAINCLKYNTAVKELSNHLIRDKVRITFGLVDGVNDPIIPKTYGGALNETDDNTLRELFRNKINHADAFRLQCLKSLVITVLFAIAGLVSAVITTVYLLPNELQFFTKENLIEKSYRITCIIGIAFSALLILNSIPRAFKYGRLRLETGRLKADINGIIKEIRVIRNELNSKPSSESIDRSNDLNKKLTTLENKHKSIDNNTDSLSICLFIICCLVCSLIVLLFGLSKNTYLASYDTDIILKLLPFLRSVDAIMLIFARGVNYILLAVTIASGILSTVLIIYSKKVPINLLQIIPVILPHIICIVMIYAAVAIEFAVLIALAIIGIIAAVLTGILIYYIIKSILSFFYAMFAP